MIVISNSSPLIALSKIRKLDILKHLFGEVYIPESVYQETVLQTHDHIQKQAISQVIGTFIIVEKSKTTHTFTRTIDSGERGVLNLAFDKQADVLIIDDKKARNEAKELGFRVVKTSTILKRAEQLGIIDSYADITRKLTQIMIYLP